MDSNTGQQEENASDPKTQTIVQKVSCPSCSELYEVNIPATGEERSVSVCPFCEKPFLIRHQRFGEKPAAEDEKAPAEQPQAAPAPEQQPPATTQPQPTPPPQQAQKQPEEQAVAAPEPRQEKTTAQKDEDDSKDTYPPAISALKAASFTFLKRIPAIIVPILGLLYLVTLGVYDAGQAGARRYMEKKGGTSQGALGIGLLFGLIFATVLVLLIYLIFSILAVEVFLAFTELCIFVFIYVAAVFFSAMGGRSAAME